MLGYCCNVHPGRNLEEVRQSLTEFSLPIKQSLGRERDLGVGLWLSATTAEQLLDKNTRKEFGDWLRASGLVPYTLNGFPYGNFHQAVVKHQVYLPTWADASRLKYTLDLIDILDDLLPADCLGTISTLPLGWPSSPAGVADASFLRACADNLQQLARALAELRARTSRQIMVCIEPEPGCVLDSAEDLVRFFEDYLGDASEIRSHLGVCHDVCHSAVMFENQHQALQTYQDFGVSICKVQVSSAVQLELDRLSAAAAASAVGHLEEFCEARYLHQTTWRTGTGFRFFADLPEAIKAVRQSADPSGDRSGYQGELRVHFHVPIFARELGTITTTQSEIESCLSSLAAGSADLSQIHFEVETYAWNVLPATWRQRPLTEGIAEELRWFEAALLPYCRTV